MGHSVRTLKDCMLLIRVTGLACRSGLELVGSGIWGMEEEEVAPDTFARDVGGGVETDGVVDVVDGGALALLLLGFVVDAVGGG